MEKFYFLCVQQQAMAVEVASEKIILFPVPVGRVAYNRMKNVFHVAPYLVVTARQGFARTRE
jgi:hypothetical protein